MCCKCMVLEILVDSSFASIGSIDYAGSFRFPPESGAQITQKRGQRTLAFKR